MFVVARKDLQLDGNNPTLLYGYGGFNSSFYPYYRPRIIPFLERGGVWVLASIRGGGEFGQEWHEGGRRQYKQNCFDDFYAAAREADRAGLHQPVEARVQGRQQRRPAYWSGRHAAARPVPGGPVTGALDGHGALLQVGDGALNGCTSTATRRTPTSSPGCGTYSPYHRVVDGVDYPADADRDGRVGQPRRHRPRLQDDRADAGSGRLERVRSCSASSAKPATAPANRLA